MSTSQTVGTAGTPVAPGRGLRRELHFWEAIALSIGIMAPTAAMALNGTAARIRVPTLTPCRCRWPARLAQASS